MSEFGLIARLTARAGTRSDVALGIGDDAALLEVPAGEQLVACCDALNEGVHFLAGTEPADIGWKSLAVNLSDLAAMGARPAWALLSLSLPRADAGFVDGFMRGFSALADAAGIALVGGDTTSGPLSISVTALGFAPRGLALTRGGARPGDSVFVSGTLGDASAALERIRAGRAMEGAQARALAQRMRRPTPRLALGQALRGVASAAIDISDGLLADLGHIAERSRVDAEVFLGQLPYLPDGADPQLARQCQLAGGDDYELVFSAAPDKRTEIAALAAELDLALWRIGQIVAGSGEVRLLDADGQTVPVSDKGFDHFGHQEK